MKIRFMRRKLASIAIVAFFLGASGPLVSAAPLPRDHIVLKSALAVDPDRNTVILPLHKGTEHGRRVYYILADSSSREQAETLGLNYAPAIGKAYTQRVSGDPNNLAFSGAPIFSSNRVYTPSPTGFPPKAATPGSLADDTYSPFVTLPDGTTLDAPIVATGDGPFDVTMHHNTADRILAIDTDKLTVTILLAHGFFNGSQVLYLSTDASDPGVASIERATYTPKLGGSSAASEQPIVALANGQTGAGNPQAQGLAHLALDGRLSEPAVLSASSTFGSPLNILATFSVGASAGSYTPLWAGNVGLWSSATVASHNNVRLASVAQVYTRASKGEITAPGGKAFGPAGFVVNCPVVAFIEAVK